MIKTRLKQIGYGVAALFAVIALWNSVETVNMGYTKVYQNTMTGSKHVYHGPDLLVRPPFVSTVTEYKDDTTLSFTTGKDSERFTSTNNPISVAFADTYKAQVIMNARMVLPTDDNKMLALHKAFRNYDNLVRSLYTKTLVDVTTNTATQFTAEEIFQGGLNGLKSAIEDQAANGVFVTERRKVVSEMGVTDRVEPGEKKEESRLTEKAVYVWKAIPKLDSNNKPIRTKNPLDQYGVNVTQVNLAEPIPEPLLERLLNEKKTLVAKKIASIQKQENAKTDMETAKLEGEAKRIKAEQEKLVQADAEIIELKKQVTVAEQQALKEKVERQKLADLAVIDKKKELQIAQDNEGIQRANAKAAKYEGQAIEEKGLAEANVKRAMYLAVKKDILELEVEKATQLAKYKALESGNVKIEMPKTVMTGGSGDGASLQELTNLTIMDKLGSSQLKGK
ncbi:MAG: hypothetical protein BV456_04805 [Thermoplasmata archaeon M8B2D]|nr:MAG: hypothetical protein BV456_04805 [Thermoplasmata archaeon M8B2D]